MSSTSSLDRESAPSNEPQSVGPPVARTVEHTELHHGVTVSDDYYWLRNKSDAAVAAYLESENAYTESQTKESQPFADALYVEMLSHIKQTDLSVPVRRDNYLYYSRTEEGKQYPVHCRRHENLDAPEQILLDLNDLAGDQKFISLGSFAVSDDGHLLAYALDYQGFRQYDLHVKDLRTGNAFPDTMARVTGLRWIADNQTLLLTTEDEVTKRSDKVWRHQLGSTAFDLLYEEKDELFAIHLARSRDKQCFFVTIESSDTTECLYLPAARAAAGNFAVFTPRKDKHRYYLDCREDLFYIRTNRNGKDFEIATARETDHDPADWQTFVAHRPGTLIEEIDLFHTFAVLLEKSEALNRLRVYEFKKEHWTEIPFGEPIYSVSPGSTPEYHSTAYRYTYESFVTPPSVYDYDTETGTSKLLKQQEVPGGYDPSRYRSERLWATARDGTDIPVSIVYKNELLRDGSGPLFLYGYGSYGIGMPVTFSAARLVLLDRGVAYAIAHIRGGDELGEQWREDGMLMKKKNTFWDFIDVAEYLIEQQWTSSDRLMIEGGSAGGLLMGAVVNQRPELFRAAHLAVPFLDVMNTMMDASLPLTVGEYLEWGNPNETPAYDYMRTYSPYDNLEAKAYPAMLVTTSFNDSQVMYWEPAKYVARLRKLRRNDAPLLLKTRMKPAGHGGASGRYDRLRDTAFEYAWFLKQVGITR